MPTDPNVFPLDTANALATVFYVYAAGTACVITVVAVIMGVANLSHRRLAKKLAVEAEDARNNLED